MLGARNRPKTSKIAFLGASKRLSKISLNFNAFCDRFEADLDVFGMSKNEEKCGSVCSDSFFGVRNLTSNLGAFWTGFWEGLGSVLAGFWQHVGVKSCLKGVLKATSISGCVSKPKNVKKEPKS